MDSVVQVDQEVFLNDLMEFARQPSTIDLTQIPEEFKSYFINMTNLGQKNVKDALLSIVDVDQPAKDSDTSIKQ